MPGLRHPNTASRRLLTGSIGVPLVIAALILLPGLGELDLWSPDEPRYAQVAEEMRSFQHGFSGLILLHLLGEPYGQKPPLYYWLAAALGAPFGHVGHLAARLPSALSGIAVVGLTALLGRRLFARPEVGNLAALLLLGVLRFSHQARRAQLDVLLCLCELSALLAFWWLDRPQTRAASPRTAPLFWLHASVALGLLVKGPVAALPYAIIIIFLVWERRTGDLRRLFPYWSPVLALGPGLAWLGVSLALAPAGFLDQAVTENLFQRFTSGLHHARPFYYYLYQLPADFLPWTPVALVAIVSTVLALHRKTSGSDGPAHSQRFLLTWAGAFLIFFSISAEKRGLYLLPAFPALALLSAGWLSRFLDRPALPAWLLAGSMLLFGAVGAASVIILATGIGGELTTGTSIIIPWFVYWAFAASGIGTVAVLAWARWGRADGGLQVLSLILAPLILEGLFLSIFLPTLNHEKSPRPIAEVATRAASHDTTIGVYRYSSLAGGIAYYSNHRTLTLENPMDLAGFIESGGRVVITRGSIENELHERIPGHTLARMREDRRSIVIFEATDTPESLRGTLEGE